MKKLLLSLLLLVPFAAVAQSPARFDLPIVTTTAAQIPPGSLPNLLAVSNATISVCGFPATLSNGVCTNTVTTYTDSTLSSPCPSTAQLTAPGTSVCIPTTGLQGAFGFWYNSATQTHMTYTVQTPWGTFGPYDILQGGSGGSGGVSTFSADNLAPLFTTSVSNPSTTPALSFTASTFGSHTFYGNNGSSSATPGASLIGVSDWSPNAFLAGSGSAQVQTVTLTPPATALTPGLEVRWLPVAANTATAPTLNVNGLGARAITKLGAAGLVANDLTTSAIADAIYDGTRWQLQNPQTATGGGGPCADCVLTLPTGPQTIEFDTNAPNILELSNSNGGSSAATGIELTNGTDVALFALYGTGYSVPGSAIFQLTTPGAPFGIVTNNSPIFFQGSSTTSLEGVNTATDTGTLNAYVAYVAECASSPVYGTSDTFVAANSSTGPSTFSWCSGDTPTTLVKNGSTALASGDIIAGGVYTVVFDGTNWQLLNSSLTGGGAVGTAGQIQMVNLTTPGALAASALTDNGTTVSSSEPVSISASGTPSQIGFTYNGTPLVPGSSTTAVLGVNSSGQAVMSEAGGTAAQICDATNGLCPTLAGNQTFSGTNTFSQNLALSQGADFAGAGSFVNENFWTIEGTTTVVHDNTTFDVFKPAGTATSSANFPSMLGSGLQASYWTGSQAALGMANPQVTCAAGNNPLCTWTLNWTPDADSPTHGGTATFNESLPGPLLVPSIVTSACTGCGNTDTRPIQTTSIEYITVNPSASYTFSTSPTSPSTAGTANFIHLTLGPTTDGFTAAQKSTITITCDGDTETVSAGMFFAGKDDPASWWTDQIGNMVNVATTVNTENSMNHVLEINYSTGCTFTFNNASAVTPVILFGEVQYRVGPNVSRSTRQHWHAYEIPVTQVAQYASLSLLPTTGAADGGELESMSLWVIGGANFGYQEGDPSVTADGNTAITANGTEDFFGCGYNCINGKGGMQLSKWGQFNASGFGTGSSLQWPVGINDSMLYRFFSTNDRDNVLFTSSLATAWPNGSSGQGSAPGIVNAKGLVTWWTKDPMAQPVTYSVVGGQISLPVTVTLATATSSATICSTTDGSAPIGNGAGGCTHGTSGTSVTVSAAETVQAIATKSGFADSEITNQYYAPTQTLGFIAGNTASNTATSTSITSASITFNAGDHAVIFCRASYSAGSRLNVTSSVAGNVVVGIGDATLTGTSNGHGQLFYVDQMVGGATTFTCTSDPTQTFLGIAVLDYGAGTTRANTAAGAAISTATLSPVTRTFSTTGAGLVVACFDPMFAASSLTAGTIGGATATARAASVNFECEDVVTGSAQTNITATMTAGGTAGGWDYGVITFQ